MSKLEWWPTNAAARRVGAERTPKRVRRVVLVCAAQLRPKYLVKLGSAQEGDAGWREGN